MPPEVAYNKGRFQAMYDASAAPARNKQLEEALAAVLAIVTTMTSPGEIKMTWAPHLPKGITLSQFLEDMRQTIVEAVSKELSSLHIESVLPPMPEGTVVPAGVLLALGALTSFLKTRTPVAAVVSLWKGQPRTVREVLEDLTGVPASRTVTPEILEDIRTQFMVKAETTVGSYLAGKAPPWVTKFLVNRGVHTAGAAKSIMEGEDVRHDPKEMAGMSEAVNLVNGMLKNSMETDDKTCIFGDYDLDGISGTAMLYKALGRLGWRNLTFRLPTRNKRDAGGETGYGIHDSDVKAMAADGVKNLILVDTGTNANGPISMAKKLGMRVLVLDHHLPEHHLSTKEGEPPVGKPDADVILNPHQHGDTYGNKELSAAGVTHKLVSELYKHHGRGDADDFLDFAGLGMLADQMEISPENRYMIKRALDRLGHSKFPGVAALTEGNHKDGAVSSQNMAFSVNPALNAPGRIDDPVHALYLLLAKNGIDASKLKGYVDYMLSARKSMAGKMEKEAKVAAASVPEEDPLVVLLNTKTGDDGWHPGVVGQVAPSIMELRHKPVIMAGMTADGKLVGSARAPSESPFNWDTAFKAAMKKGLLLEGGGHAHAAGFTADPAKAGKLSAFLNDYARDQDLTSVVDEQAVDHEVGLDELSEEDILKWVHALEPFGPGNPEPLLEDKDVILESVNLRAAGEIKVITNFIVEKKGESYHCMMWGSDYVDWLRQHIGKHIGIKYTPDYSTFSKAPQIRVKKVF